MTRADAAQAALLKADRAVIDAMWLHAESLRANHPHDRRPFAAARWRCVDAMFVMFDHEKGLLA